MTEHTGADPEAGERTADDRQNLGAYFLTVGLVTIAFGSVFTLVFSGIVVALLLAVVVGVAIISVSAGLYSDSKLLFPEA